MREGETLKMSEIIKSIEKAQLRTDRPDFNVGDTLRVFVKVVEGNRERLQAFEGTVIARRNGSCRETFTVRRVSYGIGVERTFRCILPALIISRSSAVVRCAVRSSITCAVCRARPPRSRTSAATKFLLFGYKNEGVCDILVF